MPAKDKMMSRLEISQLAQILDDERPLWRQTYGNMHVEDVAKMMLRLWVLKKCDWCRTQAAEVLGISLRTLTTHLNLYRDRGYVIEPPSVDLMRAPLRDEFWNELKQRIELLGE